MLCPLRRVLRPIGVTEMTIRLLVVAMLLAAPAAQPQADRDHMLATLAEELVDACGRCFAATLIDLQRLKGNEPNEVDTNTVSKVRVALFVQLAEDETAERARKCFLTWAKVEAASSLIALEELLQR